MTLLTAYKNKNILVLGAGLTGMSCARYLASQQISFTVNDSRNNPFTGDYSAQDFINEFKGEFNSDSTCAEASGLVQSQLVLGSWNVKLIANADVIILSPGIDPVAANISPFISDDCQVIGDVELFCLLNNEREQPINILAVTGSNGKSTVVSLLAHLANKLGIKGQLGGNIGQPVLDVFTAESNWHQQSQRSAAGSTQVPELLLLELSSFQLETLTSMKAIASTVLNVSDDHLDRHQTMANYQAIKQTVYAQANIALVNRDDPATLVTPINQQLLSFGSDAPVDGQFGVRFSHAPSTENTIEVNNKRAFLAFGEQQLIALEQLPLAGMHNALNYLAALALGYSAGWSLTAMVTHLSSFVGLAHRCQRVNTNDGITWINDSKATNVGATIAAIDGLAKTLTSEQKLILIAGGDGKGADFTSLAKPFAEHVSHVITLGKDGNSIADIAQQSIHSVQDIDAQQSVGALQNIGAQQSNVTTRVNELSLAVRLAQQLAKPGDIVLLSPACASIDMFKNFVERGQQFMESVNSIVGVEL